MCALLTHVVVVVYVDDIVYIIYRFKFDLDFMTSCQMCHSNSKNTQNGSPCLLFRFLQFSSFFLFTPFSVLSEWFFSYASCKVQVAHFFFIQSSFFSNTQTHTILKLFWTWIRGNQRNLVCKNRMVRRFEKCIDNEMELNQTTPLKAKRNWREWEIVGIRQKKNGWRFHFHRARALTHPTRARAIFSSSDKRNSE